MADSNKEILARLSARAGVVVRQVFKTAAISRFHSATAEQGTDSDQDNMCIQDFCFCQHNSQLL
jgi:hypothetical protein